MKGAHYTDLVKRLRAGERFVWYHGDCFDVITDEHRYFGADTYLYRTKEGYFKGLITFKDTGSRCKVVGGRFLSTDDLIGIVVETDNR